MSDDFCLIHGYEHMDRDPFAVVKRCLKCEEERCICQDQHRRGYCTEPTCPYRIDQQLRSEP